MNSCACKQQPCELRTTALGSFRYTLNTTKFLHLLVLPSYTQKGLGICCKIVLICKAQFPTASRSCLITRLSVSGSLQLQHTKANTYITTDGERAQNTDHNASTLMQKCKCSERNQVKFLSACQNVSSQMKSLTFHELTINKP